jgi:enediyne biosynthesis protein E4
MHSPRSVAAVFAVAVPALLALAVAPGGAALRAQSFTEITAAAGIAGDYAPQPTDTLNVLFTGGIAAGDVDGDGWEDLVVPMGSSQPLRLYRNDGGGEFTDIAAAAGVAVSLPIATPLLADVDGDGDLDLFLTMVENVVSVQGAAQGGGMTVGPLGTPSVADQGAGPGLLAHDNRLYLNDGAGHFSAAPDAGGLSSAGRYGAACGDLDADGDLDLVALTWQGHRAQFFRNQGDGTFRENTPLFFEVDKVYGFTPRLVDHDLDGDLDILCANDVHTSRLIRNNGGWSFSNVTQLAGVGTDENGMGSTVADVDRDGDLDWFVTAIYSPVPIPIGGYFSSGNRLYANNGNGTYTDKTDSAGVRDGGWGWGAQFADLDNDGDVDLAQANGWYSNVIFVPQLLIFDHDTLRLYMNDGAGHFTDRAADFGLVDDAQGRGIAVFDVDHDGALDVLVMNNDVGPRLWRGSPAGLGHWLHVELRQPGMNRFAVGARVTVTAAGLPAQLAPMECGNNYLSQAPQSLWFGLGAATSASVAVRWPDGSTSAHAVGADTRVVLTKPR